MRGDLEIHALSEEHLDDAAALLAERHQRHREAEPLLADVADPHVAAELAHAATLDAVRGSGVGLALTAHVLRWAHEHGFLSMTTDWRSVNVLSSRFWPRRGVRPTFVRMYRAVP